MAGRRPDQYQIDPGARGASDHKNLPQVGKGKSSKDETTRFDKANLNQQEERLEGSNYMPEGGKPAPTIHANAGTKELTSEEARREAKTQTGREGATG